MSSDLAERSQSLEDVNDAMKRLLEDRGRLVERVAYLESVLREIADAETGGYVMPAKIERDCDCCLEKSGKAKEALK